MGIYQNLTAFLPLLDGSEYGDWIIDRVHDGTPENPIRFSDGALLDFLQSGAIKKWLERLRQFEVGWLFTLSDFLLKKGLLHDGTIGEKVKARQDGKSFSFSEHLKSMIYAMLSGQRTWGEIVPHLPEIDELFYNYDADKILAQPYTYFVGRIQKIKCGNRRIKLQMQQLPDNIGTFRAIERKYGNLDAYVTSAPAYQIVDELATGKYKLQNMREALCWEYLRNVGVDGAKPDTHLRRFLGSNRMGVGNHPTATIPDPACGSGGFLVESLRYVWNKLEAKCTELG